MLLNFLITAFISILHALTFWVPSVTSLPFGIDDVLVQGFGYAWYLAIYFPPIALGIDFLIWLLKWKIGLKLFSMIPLIRNVLYK